MNSKKTSFKDFMYRLLCASYNRYYKFEKSPPAYDYNIPITKAYDYNQHVESDNTIDKIISFSDFITAILKSYNSITHDDNYTKKLNLKDYEYDQKFRKLFDEYIQAQHKLSYYMC